MNNIENGCICQNCGKLYKIDILIEDNWWELIKPEGKELGGGLLCGVCIFKKLESIGKFGAFKLVDVI